jgi:hypothetical protein
MLEATGVSPRSKHCGQKTTSHGHLAYLPKDFRIAAELLIPRNISHCIGTVLVFLLRILAAGTVRAKHCQWFVPHIACNGVTKLAAQDFRAEFFPICFLEQLNLTFCYEQVTNVKPLRGIAKTVNNL